MGENSYTLIGSIAHADIYSGGMKTQCDGTVKPVTAASFIAAQAGGTPDIFLLDYYGLLTCVEDLTGPYTGTGTSYQAYSVDPNQGDQATLTSRYRNPNAGGTGSVPGQNDVFQVMVGEYEIQTGLFHNPFTDNLNRSICRKP